MDGSSSWMSLDHLTCSSLDGQRKTDEHDLLRLEVQSSAVFGADIGFYVCAIAAG